MVELYESVPNFSEGRDILVRGELVRAAQKAYWLDEDADPDHNRTVVTLAGPRPKLMDALLAAVACEWLKRQGHRVAYVDVDVHHGDGVEHIFAADPDVLTISLHESGHYLFPGTGFPQDAGVGAGRGSAANLPFMPYTWDEPWLHAFEMVVPTLLRRFQPTVLVTQDGCDSHHLDPLAHIANTTRIWPRVGSLFHELAHELCEGRWVALGGGGYAIYEVVPRAWTLLFAEMVEHPELAAELDDPATVVPSPEAQERVWRALRNDLDRLGEVHGMDF